MFVSSSWTDRKVRSGIDRTSWGSWRCVWRWSTVVQRLILPSSRTRCSSRVPVMVHFHWNPAVSFFLVVPFKQSWNLTFQLQPSVLGGSFVWKNFNRLVVAKCVFAIVKLNKRVGLLNFESPMEEIGWPTDNPIVFVSPRQTRSAQLNRAKLKHLTNGLQEISCTHQA